MYTLAVLFLAFEMGLQVSPSVMTDYLIRDFHISAAILGLMASTYFWSYAAMQIPAGMFFDLISPKYLVSGSIGILSLGALFFGVTESVGMAALGRFLMGIGSAFAFISVLVIARQWYNPKAFAFLTGVAQMLAALGAMGGELPLAYFVNHYGWRDVIFFLAMFGFVLTVLTFIFVERNAEMPAPPKKQHLLEDMREIFRSGQTWWIAVYGFCGWGPIAVFASMWGVPFLMEKYSIPNTQAAFAIGSVWVGLAITAPLIGYLSDYIQNRTRITSLSALLGFIASMLLLFLDVPYVLLFPLLFAMGVASAGQILSFALVADTNKPAVTGTAIGFNNMAVVLGGAILQPLTGFILNYFWDGSMENGIPFYGIFNYELALLVVPICYAYAYIASAFFINETNCQNQYSPDVLEDISQK